MHMSQALTVAPLLPSSGSQAVVHYGPHHLPASAHPQPPPHPPPAHTINTASDLMTEGRVGLATVIWEGHASLAAVHFWFRAPPAILGHALTGLHGHQVCPIMQIDASNSAADGLPASVVTLALPQPVCWPV